MGYENRSQREFTWSLRTAVSIQRQFHSMLNELYKIFISRASAELTLKVIGTEYLWRWWGSGGNKRALTILLWDD